MHVYLGTFCYFSNNILINHFYNQNFFIWLTFRKIGKKYYKYKLLPIINAYYITRNKHRNDYQCMIFIFDNYNNHNEL